MSGDGNLPRVSENGPATQKMAPQDAESSSIGGQQDPSADSLSVHPQQQQEQQQLPGEQQQPAEDRKVESSEDPKQHQQPTEQQLLSKVPEEVGTPRPTGGAEILQASLSRSSAKRKVPGQLTESSRRMKVPAAAVSSEPQQLQTQTSSPPTTVQQPLQQLSATPPLQLEQPFIKQEGPSSPSFQQRYDISSSSPPKSPSSTRRATPLPTSSSPGPSPPRLSSTAPLTRSSPPPPAGSPSFSSPRPKSAQQPAEAFTQSPSPRSSSPLPSSPQINKTPPPHRPSLETTRSPAPSVRQTEPQPVDSQPQAMLPAAPSSGSRAPGSRELEPHLRQHLEQHQHQHQQIEVDISETDDLLDPDEPESDWGPMEKAADDKEDDGYVSTTGVALERPAGPSPHQLGAGGSSSSSKITAVQSEAPAVVALSSLALRHRQIPRPPPSSYPPPPQHQRRVQPQPQPQPQQPQQHAAREAPSRLPEVQQQLAIGAGPGPVLAVDKAELMRQLYARYATAPGQPRIVTVSDFAQPRMSGSQLQRLVTALGLMQPSGPLTQETVGSIYARCKPPGTRKLNFLNFLRVLSKLHQESGGADVWGAASQLAVRINRKHQKNNKQQAHQPQQLQQQQQPQQPQQPHQLQQRRVLNPPSLSSQLEPPAGPSRAANIAFGGGSGGGSGIAGGPQNAFGEDASHLSDSEVASAPLLLPRLPAVAPNHHSNAGGGSGGGAPITAPQVIRKYSEPMLAPVAGGRGIHAVQMTSFFPTTVGSRMRLPNEPGVGAVAVPLTREAFAASPTGRPSPQPPPLRGIDDHVTSEDLPVAGRHPGALQRSLTGIAALPQGYALLATAPPLAAPPAALSAPTASASVGSVPTTSAAMVAAAETVQTLLQRVICLEEQSQEHKTRHAELRLEMLQKLAEVAATSTLAAAAAPPQLPQSAPAAQQTPDAVDAAHVAVTAAGTAHRAEVGAAAAARVANSAAATAAAAGREVEHMEDRISACEAMIRQQLEGMREQRDAVESFRDQMTGMEASITSIVMAAVSAHMEQKLQQQLEKELEKRLQERLKEVLKVTAAHEARLQQLQRAQDQAAAATSPSAAVAAVTAAATTAAVAATEQRLAGLESTAAASAVTAATAATVQRLGEIEATVTTAATAAATAAMEQRLAGIEATVTTAAAAAAVAAMEQRMTVAGTTVADAQQAANTAAEATTAAASRIDTAVAELTARLNATESQILATLRHRILSLPGAAATGRISPDVTAMAAATSAANGVLYEDREKDLTQRPSEGVITVADANTTGCEPASRKLADHLGIRSLKHIVIPAPPPPVGSSAVTDGVGNNGGDEGGGDGGSAGDGEGDAAAADQSNTSNNSSVSLREAERHALKIRVAACERMAAADALTRSMHHTVLDNHYHLLDEHTSELRRLDLELAQLQEQVHELLLQQKQRQPVTAPPAPEDGTAAAAASGDGGGGGDSGGSQPPPQPPSSSEWSRWRSQSHMQSELQWQAQLMSQLHTLQSQVDSLHGLHQSSQSLGELSKHLAALSEMYRVLEEQLEDLTSKVGWMQAKALSSTSPPRPRPASPTIESQPPIAATTAAGAPATATAVAAEGTAVGENIAGTVATAAAVAAAAELTAASELRLRKDLDSVREGLTAHTQNLEQLRSRLDAMERTHEAMATAAASGVQSLVSEQSYVTKAELEDLQRFTQSALEELSSSLRRLDGNSSDLTVDMQHAAKDVGRLLVQVRQLQQHYEDLAESIGMARYSGAGGSRAVTRTNTALVGKAATAAPAATTPPNGDETAAAPAAAAQQPGGA
ncbi:hypothetical protein VaNZ11_009034 [Volvox africanus]|uniref:Uncharacterized protein n=1 Tax=Volvox africanus TaxID=51714 RepID=A0ABQ5S6N9_9CHLO|nr:hypothetical protein VaNZ11_009034 [Volvox africanus]